MTDAAPIALKLLLIGSSSVGKSSLLLRYTDHLYLPSEETQATIGVDYKVKMITRGDKKYKISIWDTAGQERFRTLTSSYYRGCHGVLIVYGIDQRDSFDALQTWFSELETYASPDVIKFIIGNKTDRDFSRQVSTAEGKQVAQDRYCEFYETSARNEGSVEQVFDALVDKIIASPGLYEQKSKTSLPGSFNVALEQEQQGSTCAC